MTRTPTVTLCGPQRLAPTVGKLLRDRGTRQPVALITAGWRERETDDVELRETFEIDTVNLGLYRRWKSIADADPEYFDLHRKRQDRLKELQRVYRKRLHHVMDGARAVFEMKGSDELLAPERASAVNMIADLDRHHLRRVKEIHLAFEAAVQPGKRRAIAAQRDEVASLVDGLGTVLIAGGHTAILLNRLRLLGLRSLLKTRDVIAWSAGAMAMTSHVLLFHDFPPWGPGDAEILDHGLGLAPGIVALPHAHRRLDLGARQRVASMARRAAPSICLTLPDGAHVTTLDGKVIDASGELSVLSDEGLVVPFRDRGQS